MCQVHQQQHNIYHQPNLSFSLEELCLMTQTCIAGYAALQEQHDSREIAKEARAATTDKAPKWSKLPANCCFCPIFVAFEHVNSVLRTRIFCVVIVMYPATDSSVSVASEGLLTSTWCLAC